MPPRRIARVAELQQPQALLGPLEGDFAKAFLGRILSSLPLDERLRAREVSRGWRLFLNDASFWTHVDVGKSCGVIPRFLNTLRLALPLLRTACVRATGSLQSVDPYELLTVGKLHVCKNEDGGLAVLDLASALSVYKGVEKLHIHEVPLTTRAVRDALVDAAVSAGIKDMCFDECGLSQTALPALTRLLQSPGFEGLTVWNRTCALLEGPALPAFCEALRNSKSLKMKTEVECRKHLGRCGSCVPAHRGHGGAPSSAGALN